MNKKPSLNNKQFTGIKAQKVSNYRQNMKAPKLGGGEGVAAPANIAKALGVSVGMPVHAQMLAKLFTHPDMGVSSTAKRLYGNMSQHKVKQSKTPY